MIYFSIIYIESSVFKVWILNLLSTFVSLDRYPCCWTISAWWIDI